MQRAFRRRKEEIECSKKVKIRLFGVSLRTSGDKELGNIQGE